MKTLILGLGNTILSDDGVGPQVAAQLNCLLNNENTTVVESGIGGLELIDLLTGYDRAVIIDAIQTVGGEPGQIYRLDAKALDCTRHTASPHDVNFATALEFGNKLGIPLPQEIIIFAIEAGEVNKFSEECTPEVQQAIPKCIELILRELDND